jgi:choline kinase
VAEEKSQSRLGHGNEKFLMTIISDIILNNKMTLLHNKSINIITSVAKRSTTKVKETITINNSNNNYIIITNSMLAEQKDSTTTKQSPQLDTNLT